MEEAHFIQKNTIYFLQETHFSKELMEDMIYLLGSKKDILSSIKNKLLILPDETVVYPGHGEPAIISEEKDLY